MSGDTLPDADGRLFGWEPPLEQELSGMLNRYKSRPLFPLFLRGSVDLRDRLPPVYNQAPFNACTANAVAAIVHGLLIKEDNAQAVMPSRLHTYWHTRVATGTQNTDNGGSVAGAIAALVSHGFCAESNWEYKESNLRVSPPPQVETEASQNKIKDPWAPRSLGDIKKAVSLGQPVAFGFRVFNSFFSADQNNGLVPMPDITQASVKHAAVVVGYDDEVNRFIVRNSWGLKTQSGRNCGDEGHYYMPYGYFVGHLASDYWAIPKLR